MESNQEEISEDSRFHQCNIEAIVTLAFFIVNMIVTGAIPLLIGYNKSAKDINFVAGLPDWFFYGCIVGWLVLSGISVLMVKIFFKDMDLN